MCRQKYSKQYHSADEKNHVAHYRHTYYLDIPPVCKVVPAVGHEA